MAWYSITMNEFMNEKAHIFRIYLIAIMDIIVVLYSPVFNWIEFTHHRYSGGRPLPGLLNVMIQYWYCGFAIPILSITWLHLIDRRKSLLFTLMPDLLLVYCVLWVVTVNFVWELTKVPFIDLHGVHY
jgi:hypothetical protein